MEQDDERLPGAVVHVDKADLRGGDSLIGNIQLRVAVSDEEVWDALVEKLDGYRVFADSAAVRDTLDMYKERLDEARAETAVMDKRRLEAEHSAQAWARHAEELRAYYENTPIEHLAMARQQR